jgi:acyl-CoA synthetase (AMP-forming)/AMP-acid ligase II
MGTNLSQAIKQYGTAMSSMDAIIEMRKTRQGHAVICRRLSFGEFDGRIDQYVTKFLKKGIRKDSRVLMLLRPGTKMMCTFFALVRMGAIPILLDSGVGFREIVRLGNFSKPDFIICSPRLKWLIFMKILRIKGQVIAVYRSFAKRQPAATSMVEMDPEDVVAILFTSGSTGPAKGVVYRHRHFASQLSKLRLTYRLMPNVKDVTLLPVFMLFNPIFGRTTIIPDMDFSRPSELHPQSIVETIVNHCATSSFGSPILWEKIADYCSENDITMRSLEQIFLAGVSAAPYILEKMLDIAPNAKIFTPYGATECLPICSISAEEILGSLRPLQENGAGTCLGYPVEGIAVRIIVLEDGPISHLEERSFLPLGHIGEIIVEGSNVTEFYDQLPEKTALAKINYNGKIWHRMGDLGFLDEKGRIWFCGRKMERVVTESGEAYYPECIEPLFQKYSVVKRAALIKIVKNGKILPAIAILPKKDCYPFFFWQKWKLRRELRNIAQHFPKTAPIRDFFFCRSFPVDPRHNAKIHRLALGKYFSH